MERIKINFSECKYIGEFHAEIKEAFDFPEYYGENLSALWDFLDNYCNIPLTVQIEGFNEMPKELDDYKEKLTEIFKRVHKSTPNMIFEIVS